MSRDTIEIDKKGPPMTQTSKLGITPGECFLTGRNDHTEISGFMVIGIHREDNSTFATAYVAHIDDARLYADAHNVANRTGLTPSELERQRDELLEVLKEIRHFAGAGIGMAAKNDHAEAVTLATWIIEKVDEAITSATEPHP